MTKRSDIALILAAVVLGGCQQPPTPALTATTAPMTEPTRTPRAEYTRVPEATSLPLLTPEPTMTLPPQPTATSAVPAATEPPISKNTVWVSATNGLNLRPEPSISTVVSETLKYHRQLTVLETKVDADGHTWQYVRTDDGKVGWVATADTDGDPTLTTQDPNVVPTPTIAPKIPLDLWVSQDGVNLRAEANVTAKVITTLKLGQHLTALEARAGPDSAGYTWQNVRVDDCPVGWVSLTYLSTTNPITTTPMVTPTTTFRPNSDVWVNETDGLILRHEAGTAADLIKVLPFGQHLTVLEAACGPDSGGYIWQNVRTDDGQTGWSSVKFLSATKPITATPSATLSVTATPGSVAQHDVWVNAADGLKLRSQSSVTATVIVVLKFGQHLTAPGPTVAAGEITWQNVRTDDGQTGWVSTSYLSSSPPTPVRTPTPTITPTATTTP